ncbi:insecticidal toxin complex [Fusarium tjaetaba]|uniref:Insecticidal toxin complex n=1 Tax=Fusarium tjaetaba TaxID=1567544 RepID=A0A8H5QMA9_9HYPO|nr:insecticidal toxin complex [Fusarium tjaetaba]KAF5617829.1 insecticidal toxin complex [Fusarium tjaetaba]
MTTSSTMPKKEWTYRFTCNIVNGSYGQTLVADLKGGGGESPAVWALSDTDRFTSPYKKWEIWSHPLEQSTIVLIWNRARLGRRVNCYTGSQSEEQFHWYLEGADVKNYDPATPIKFRSVSHPDASLSLERNDPGLETAFACRKSTHEYFQLFHLYKTLTVQTSATLCYLVKKPTRYGFENNSSRPIGTAPLTPSYGTLSKQPVAVKNRNHLCLIGWISDAFVVSKMNRKPRYQPSDAVAPSTGGSTDSPSSSSQSTPHGIVSKGKGKQTAPTGQRVPAVISSPGLQKGIAGGSHRPIDQTFKMNPVNGTMSLTIPIPVTEGRGGFGPKLELSYNSGSGNGCFGIGWQLNLSSITRMTSKRTPMYDETDTFLLSGEDELVRMGDPERIGDDFSVQSYQPRVMGDPLKIEQWSRLRDPSDVHWRTISGSNVTCIYGQSSQTRISRRDQSGCTCIFSWLLCSSYDSFGNLITYEYKEEDTQGLDTLSPEARLQEQGRATETSGRAKYLKVIKYGNTLPNRDLSSWKPLEYDGQYHFQVVHDYGDHDLDNPDVQADSPWLVRQDRFSTAAAGFEVRWLRLCRRILMFHYFPKELSEKHCLYNMPIDVSKAQLEHMNTDNLPNLPGPDGHEWQWVDLLGEGAPGLLEQRPDGSWNFRKNYNVIDDSSAPRFDSSMTIPARPNRNLGKSAYFEDLNQDGKLELVCLDDVNKLEGFYHQHDEQWVGFTTFSSIPNRDTTAVFFKQLDLTGDGLADLVAVDPVDREIIWQENLGTVGFAPLRRSVNRTGVPQLMSDDPTVQVTVADMTGDGRPDIVQVSSGCVTYWQNLSHGQFSEPICMYNAPKLESDTSIAERIRLADINGSGTNDLIYMPASGGLHVYFNQTGNGWSDPQILESFPPVNQLSSISTVDLFGKGTACLCWSGKVSGSNSAQTLYYVDLAPGPKPNCLASYRNGRGSRVEVSYRSSNWYYLRDERAGASWSTRIGFPVQCVSQVRILDDTTGLLNTKSFTYHDGYYDAHDREFRGFGMVEKLESIVFNVDTPSEFRQPARLTKTWFHTGAVTPTVCRLERASSAALFGTYWSVESVQLEDRRDTCRALKGMQLREEILGEHGTTLTEHAYQVTDTAHQVVRLSPRKGPLQPGTYRCVPREVLKTHNDRSPESLPRYNHELILETNNFNDTLKSMEIFYGCSRGEVMDPSQKETILTYTENEYCLPILDKGNGIFVKPMPSVTRKYRIVGLDCSSDNIQSAFTRFTSGSFQMLRRIPEVPYTGQMLPPYSSEARVKVEERRTLYRDQELSQEDPLPLGQFQGYSVMLGTLDLAGGDKWFQDLLKHYLPENLGLDSFMTTYGYIKTTEEDGAVLWWRPSSRTLFDPEAESELVTARRCFYTPTITQDPFGNRSTVQMDDYNLLPKLSTDAVGNATKVDMNYRYMSPLCVVDPNRNRTTYSYDLLGRVMATARSGKENELVGDNLNTTIKLPSQADKDAFFACPTQEAAFELIGGATSYRLYCDAQTKRSSDLSDTCPTAFIDLSRMYHHADGASASDISILITYLDGNLAELQTTSLADTGKGGYKWNISEWSLRNSKGDPVRTFQPCYSNSHEFVRSSESQSKVTSMIYDPLSRLVGTLYPDHAYSKLRYGTWTTTNYDRGDTVLMDLSEDKDLSIYTNLLAKENYSPSWHASASTQELSRRAVAKASEVYSETPDKTYLDAQERPILQIRDCKTAKIKSRSVYSLSGHLAQTIDGSGRLAESVTSDLLGRGILHRGMDTGAVFTFPDCMERTVILIDGRNWKQRSVYDAAGRKTHIWLSQHDGTEFLAELTRYGESVGGAESVNLRGKVFEIRDQSGIQTNKVLDFKGNCVESTIQFVTDYKGSIDWGAESNPKLDPEVYTVRKSYDAMDRVVETYDAEGAVTRHIYGIYGQLDRVSYGSRGQKDDPWEDYMSDMRYAADGQPEQILYGNGVLATFRYDPATRLMIRKRLIRQNDRRVMEDTHYSHDVMYRVIQSNDAAQPVSYFNSTIVDARCSYTYDTIGRLSSAQGREDTNTNARGKSSVGIPSDSTRICRYTEEYQYDDADNITQVKHHAGPKGQMWVRSYAYEEKSLVKEGEAGNRLSYTSKSGQTEKWTYGDGTSTGFTGSVIAGGGMHSMDWDPFSRLKSCSRQIKKSGTPETTWYVYNSEGRRVRKVTERSSSGSEDLRKLKETFFFSNLHIYKCKTGDESGYSKDKRYHLIHSTEQKLVAIAEEDKSLSSASAPLVRYHMSDKLELDQSGLVITYEEYSPFGSSSFCLRRSKQEASRKYRFSAYERDKETGLYYCNARYYAPWLGRWISPDPLGTKDGLNLYCYCGNDPVNYVDPTGTMGTGIMKAMQIAAVPLLKNVMRMDENAKMSSRVQAYQQSWLSQSSKPPRDSYPAVMDDVKIINEHEELNNLKEYNAIRLHEVQKPLPGMSLERMRELETYTLDQYITELAKETLIAVYKKGVGAATCTIATQIALLAIPLPARAALVMFTGVVGNELAEVGANKFPTMTFRATRKAVTFPLKAINMDVFDFPNFSDRVEALMRSNRVPGLSVAVIHGDKVKSAGYGFASIKSQEPCTADTLFDIASSSKSLTAAAIALLVEDANFSEVQYGSIMSELLPDDFVMSEELHTNTVTVDDLLGHHTGMPGGVATMIHTWEYALLLSDNARSITRNLRNFAVTAPPRTRYIYCNMMYTVLTHLIETKSGQSFSEFPQERTFDRLDMTSSSLQPEGAKARGHCHRIAKGHIWDKKSASYREFDAVNCPEGQGAGSLISSANDYIKFLNALIDRNGPISQAVYQGLTRPRSERGANHRQRKTGIHRILYTAGMDLYWQGEYAVFGHSGDITGFGSRFVFLPELKFGAVIMGNSSGTNSVAAQLFRELIDAAIKSYTGPRPLSAMSNPVVHTAPPKEREKPNSKSQSHAGEMVKTNAGRGKDQKEDTSTIVGSSATLQRDVKLEEYAGDYWNPGYRNMKVEIRENGLFIDATDRSMGFTARLKHKRDQSVYDAHVRDAFDTGDEVLMTEFIIETARSWGWA